MKTDFKMRIAIGLLSTATQVMAANPFGFSQSTNVSTEVNSEEIPSAQEITLLKGFFSEINHSLLALVIPNDKTKTPSRVPVPVKYSDEQQQTEQLLQLFNQGQEQVISLNCQLYLPIKANAIEIQADNIDLGTCVDPTINGQIQ